MPWVRPSWHGNTFNQKAGRIKDILVNEGDFVGAGQALANMDTAVLEAQLREAKAELQRALIGIDTAQSLVTQRKAEKAAALAVVAQRNAEVDAANKRRCGPSNWRRRALSRSRRSTITAPHS